MICHVSVVAQGIPVLSNRSGSLLLQMNATCVKIKSTKRGGSQAGGPLYMSLKQFNFG